MNFIQKNKTVISAFVAIAIVAFSLRFLNLGAISFVADEFLDMNSAYGYSQTGVWQSWDFNYGVPASQNINEARDERAALYKWQVAKVFEYVSPTEEHARLVSVLWGIASLVVIMFAAWFFSGNITIALVAGALFAVAVSSIIFDRRLRMYAQFYPLYLLSSVLVFATLERVYQGKIAFLKSFQKYTGYHLLYGILAIITLGISFLTHQLTGTLFITVLIYILARIAQQIKYKESILKQYIISLVVMILLVVIAKVFLYSIAAPFFTGWVWLDNHYSYWNHFWSDFEHPLLAFLVVLGGVWYLSKNTKQKEGVFLFLSAFVPLVLAIWFWRRNVGPQYIFMAQSFLLILSAAFVYYHGKFVVSVVRHPLVQKYGQAAVIGVGLLLLPNYSYFWQEENAYRQPASGENTNYQKLFTIFNSERHSFEVLVTRNFRNYYFAGAKIPVYDFGGELSKQKLQKSELEKLKSEYKSGAVVLSKNDFDYVSKEAEMYLESEAFEKVSHSTIRGGNAMYKW